VKAVIPGYERAHAGAARVVALSGCLPELAAIVERQRLYEYAAGLADARVYRGRGATYGIALPGTCGRVVVRHAHRGGLPSRFVADLYLSRFPPLRELVASYRLRLLGVPTPEFVAYVTYPAAVFIRYDVATRELEGAVDLASILSDTSHAETRAAVIHATAVLLEQLAEAGAHHSDLNAKNVLLVPSASGFEATVIDVDQVRFHVPRSPMVMAANLDRLERSLRKLQLAGLAVSEGEIRSLRLRADDLHTRRRAAPDS
jgi:3-deoxy-D-manno-octulosonic acid kinase